MGLVLSTILITTSILGARLNIIEIKYTFLALCILSTILVTFSVIKKENYIYIIGAIALGLILQTTVLSDYLIGTDNHGEYFFAYKTYTEGWDWSYPYEYNSAWGTTVLAPIYSYLTRTSLEWTFKMILPFFLAVSVMVLYLLYRKIFNEKVAFLACFIGVIIPTYITELPGLGREMVSEFLLVVFLLLVFKIQIWKGWKQIVILSLVGILTTTSHYSIGIILVGFIVSILIFVPLLRLVTKVKNEINLKVLGVSLSIILVLSGAYFSTVSSGVFLEVLKVHGQLTMKQIIPTAPEPEVLKDRPEAKNVTIVPTQEVAPKQEQTTHNTFLGIRIDEGNFIDIPPLRHYDYMTKAALGLDIPSLPLEGIIYRILQLLTQIILIVGVVYYIIKRLVTSNTVYSALVLGSVILLAAVLFLPGFSSIMNATRFYHIGLIILAPVMVLGLDLVFRNSKIWILVLIVPYFLFTSGIVYEALDSTIIDRIIIPINFGLSAERTQVAGVYTNNDAKVRDWIAQKDIRNIYSDQYGTILLIEKMGKYPKYFNWEADKTPNDGYIYLRENNEITKTWIYWYGIGLRKIKDYEESGLNKALENREVLYQCGDSKVFGPKR